MRPRHPSWLSFIGHMKDSLWSVDLFRCESIVLRSHWVMVVMDVFTRRIIGFGIERADPCGASIWQRSAASQSWLQRRRPQHRTGTFGGSLGDANLFVPLRISLHGHAALGQCEWRDSIVSTGFSR
jgi:hypothetical protein